MGKKYLLHLVTVLFLLINSIFGYSQTITLFAGSSAGTGGYIGDGTGLTSYQLFGNRGLALDNSGALYIADYGNNRIRKIVGTTISTIAGTGIAGYLGDNGAATSARIDGPTAIVVDGAGNVYFSETGNNIVRKINGATGIITTVAGTGTAGAGTDGVAATTSNLNKPIGIAVDRRGNLYIADQFNNKIRRVNPAGIISTFAGTGTGSFSGEGAPATACTMHFPMWIKFDMWGNLFFEDRENNRIREVSSSNIVSTVAGFGGASGFAGDGGPATTAQFNRTFAGIKFDGAGNMYIADGDNYNVRKITAVAGLITNTDVINTVAGTHTAGFTGDGGPALSATFRQLSDVAFDSTGSYYISDSGNNVIRFVDTRNNRPHFVNGYNQSITVCENSVLNSINSELAVSDIETGQTLTWGIYSAPSRGTANVVYSATSTGATVTPSGLTYTPNPFVSGRDTFVVWVNDGLAMDTTRIIVDITSFYAGLVTPDLANVCVGNTLALTHDTAGGAWSSSNTAIATVSGAGVVTGVSGGRVTVSYSITNSCGTTAAMTELTVGNAILSTLAGTGILGYSGDGGPATAATFNNTHGISIDPAGDVYIVDDFNHVIRKITTSTGIVTTVAGTGTAGYSGEGVATTNQLNTPFEVLADGLGNLYITDGSNNRVRKVNSSGIMSTIAGTGVAGSLGDGGAATLAQLNVPSGIAMDGAGNIYIGDNTNNKIRKITPAGIISTFAGTGVAGFAGDGGQATAAQFNRPNYIHFDPNGNLIVSDNGNQRYRSINQLGIISTIIGTGVIGSTGDGGPATAATMNYPGGMAFDGAGNLYFATDGGNSVRVVNKQGIISTYAGTGTAGYSGDGGPATAGNMRLTVDVAIDANGLLLVAEQTNHLIRKVLVTAPTMAPITGPTLLCAPSTITLADVTTGGVWSSSATGIATVGSSGIVTGVSSGTAIISYSVVYPCGNLFATQVITVLMPPSPIVTEPAYVCIGNSITLTDPTTGGVWSSSNSSVATVVGGFVTGVSSGIAIVSYTITNACGTNSALASVGVGSPTIKTVAGNGSATFAGDNTPATSASINAPAHAITDAAGNIYIADFSNNRVRKVNTAGIITTIAGTGVATYTTDGIAATSSAINQPTGLCFDPSGNLYIADYANHRVRKINTSGIISTVAGTGTAGYTGDGFAATSAQLYRPTCLVSDPSGNIYFTDGQNCVVRKIATTGIITTVAGNGIPGYLGDNVPATSTRLWFPSAITMDTHGNLYIADQWSNRIREISTAGIITTVAGTGASGSGTGSYGGDGGAATLAHINNPSGVAFDSAGNLFISDYYSSIIRVVNTSGIINTIAGIPTSSGFLGDGGPPTAAKINHPNNIWVDNNGNAFIPDAANNRIREVYIANSTVAPITGPTSVCQSSTITLASATVGGVGVWSSSATGVATIGSTTGIVTGVTVGTTIITYSVTFPCGNLFTTQTITVNPLPVISGPTSFCLGSTASYTALPSGGTWSTSNSAVAIIGSTTGIATGVGNGTVNIINTLSTGCTASYSVTVNIIPAAIAGPASVCTGSTVTLTDPSGTTTWSSSNNLVATIGSATGIVSGISAGTVTITFALASGCYTTRLETVNVTPAAISGSNHVCLGATSNLTDITGSGSWISSNTSVATIGSTTGVLLGTGVGTSIITYALATGCFTTLGITVNNSPAPIIGPTSVCTGSTITLNDITGGGTWTSSNILVATVGTSSAIVTGVASGTATITYSIATGCNATYNITVNPSPAAITGANNVCLGSSTTLSDVTSGGIWTSSNTAVATIGTTGIVFGASAGTTTITYALAGGCFQTFGLTVNNAPAPITGPTTVCTGSNITLNDVTGTGNWSSSNTTVATIGATTGVVSGLTVGTTTITYSLGTGCIATSIIAVNLTPAVITGTNNICLGSSTTLNDVTGGGTWTSSNTTAATIGTTGIVFGASVGTTTITYALASGCYQTFGLNVNNIPAAITGPTNVCTGANITLNDVTGTGNWTSSNTAVASIGVTTGVVTGLSAGTTTITYSLGTGCIATYNITVNLTPAIITGTNNICVGGTTTLNDATGSGTWSSSNNLVAPIGSLSAVVTGISAGTVTISYILPGGCSQTFSMTINPTPAAITGPASVCTGSSITLNDVTGIGVWTSSNTGVATIVSGTGVVSGVSTGTTMITYALGTCIATTVITVNLTPVAITGSSSLCVGASTNLSDLTPGGTWISSTTSVATIGSLTGNLIGVGAGTSTISYVMPTGCLRTTVFSVNSATSAISGANNVCLGFSTTLTDGGGGIWSTSNSLVATIGSGTGVVTGVGVGTATITYTLSAGCTAIMPFTVNANPVAITPAGSINICSGATFTLSDGTSGGTWSSGSTGIATVGVGTGLVTGVSPGTAAISYILSTGCYATDIVTINISPVAIIPSTVTVCTSGITTLTDGTPGGVWTSGNVAIATIGTGTGVVSGITVGTVVITYTVGTCFRTATVTVATSPVVAPIIGAANVCNTVPVVYTDATPAGVWSSSSISVATVGSTTGVVTGITSGTAIISYTLTTLCGSVFSTATVNVSVLGAGTISGPSIICSGMFTTMTDAVSGGVWSVTNANATITGGGGLTGISAGIDTIKYTVTNVCGTAVTSKTISIGAFLTAGTIIGGSTVCAGSTLTLTDGASGGVWSSSNSSASVSGGIVTGLSAGLDTISYTVSSSCGTAIATHTVMVNAAPVAGSISGLSIICAGSFTTYTNAATGGTWSVTNATATINSSGILTAVSAGTDTIKYTVTNSCGTAIATKTLLIGPFLSAGSITGPSMVCVGSTVTLTDPVTGGVWSPTNTNASVGITGIVTGLIAGPVTISYTVSSACGVIAATHSMTINPLPVAGTITGPANLCTGTPATYTDASSGGTWSISNSRATISSGGVVSPLSNGLDTITYTVTNSCGTARTTQTISIGTAASAGTITGPASLCGTASITLTDAVSGGVWSASNGNATVSGGVVTGVTPGIDTISYTVTNTCGTATATKIVTISPIPVVYSIVGPNSVCAGSFTIYTDTATGGTWSLTNGSATITTAGVLSALVPGATDTIIYTITNSCGTATTSKVISIGILLSAGTISGPSNVCVGSGIILTDGVSGGVWTSSNTAVATVGTSGVVIGVSSGTSMITYTYTNSCGSVYTTAMVNVNPAPNAGTITGPSTVCAGTYTTYGDTAAGGVWSVTNSAATITPGGILIAITPLATDTIMYTVTTACSTAVTTKVVSIGTLISSGTITGPSSVCIIGTATLTNSVSGGVWTSGNTTIANIGSSTGVVNGVGLGTATISYTVNLACGSSTATTVISVSPIPNAGTIGGAPTVCAGTSITLTETATTGVWSSSNATATVTSGGVVNGILPGIDTILYTVTNGCGTAIATKTITITTVPSVGPITGPSSVCQLANITLLNGVSGGVWTSSNSAVASIGSSTGVVTGGISGSAIINYTVTNACGSTTVSKTISVSPLADPGTITGPDSLCITTTTTYIDLTPGGFWSVGNTNATITSGGVATGMAVGTVPVSYSVTNGCGTQSAVRIVTIVPSPFTATITGSSAVCVGSVLTLSDSIPGGTWLCTNTNAVVTGPGLITGANPGTDTVIYIVTNICGTATTSKVITINPMPVIAPITGANSECTGASITLADATAGGFWTSSDPAIASVGSTTGVVTGISAGTAAITYTVINSFGCGTGVIMFDTVILSPATPPIGGSTYVCQGGTTTLTNASPGGTWNSSDISIASIDAVTGVMSGITAGTVIVTYSQITSCGSSTASRVETVSPLPTIAAISGIMHECPGSTTTLSDATAGGLWSSADNTIATVGSITGIVTGITSGTVSIIYTYSNGLGCTNSVSAIDTVNSSLALSPITGTTSECVGATTTLSNSTPGGVWTSSNPAVATVGATTGIVTGVTTGNTTIVYTVTSSGCSGSVSIVDTVNNLPTVAAITGPVSECQGTTVTLSNATSGGIWTSSNPAIASIGSLSGVVTGNTTGNVNIFYSVSAGAGCTTTVSARDTVLALPFVAGITGTVSICVGATSTLSDATSGGVWSSGSILVATIGMSTGLVTGINPGTSDITYTVVNSRGCHSTVGTIVTIVAAPIVAAITGTTNECIGATSTLSNTTTGGIWTSSNPAIASVGSLTGIVTGVTAGSVNILYTVSSGSGCSTSVSTPDTVNATPVRAPITGSLNVCIGSTTTLANSVAGGVWTSANTTLATINPSTGVVSGLANGSDRIYYTVSNGCGSIIDSTNITINPLPSAGTITAAYTNLCAGTSLHLTENVTGGVWGSANTAIATVNTSGTVTGVSAGTVIITYKVTSSAGCVNTASTMLTIGGSLGSVSVLPSGSATLCNSGSITMHVSTTTTGLTYQWMRGGAPIAGATNFSYSTTTAGVYSVMISNGTCSLTLAGPSIVAPPNPVISYTSPNILYTGSTYASYQWYLNSVMIAGANTSSYHYTNGGLYTVSVTDGNGCGGTSLPYAVTGVNGVNDVNGAELIKIYPNPAITILNIEAQKSINVVLYSMDGKMLIEQKDATSINITGLANGLYLIMIYDQDNHLIQTSKFTKAE